MQVSITNMGANVVRVVLPTVGSQDLEIGPGETELVTVDGLGSVQLRELGILPASQDPAQNGQTAA